MSVEYTKSPWRWADWTASFGEVENPSHMRWLEHNPEALGKTIPVIRRRDDECLGVLEVQDPLENPADAELIRASPELREALDEMLDTFGGNMDRADEERFRALGRLQPERELEKCEKCGR